MKRLTLILCLLLLLIFSGCGSNQDNFSTLIAICSGKAQEYIDAGDYTAAIEVLEEGIAASDSENLKAMLEEIQAQTSEEAEKVNESELILCRSCEAEMPVDAKFCPLCGASVESDPPTEVDPEPFDMTPYLGTWAADGSCYENGGVILTALSSNGELLLELSYIQSAPGCRVAFVQGSMPWDDVQGSSFTWDVDDDGWGNSADIVVDFYEDSVCVSVSNVVNTSGDSPFWGLDEGECWLLRSDTAWDAMQEPEQTYSDTYQYENQVTYDTSKASGILASLGMTEEAFKLNCTYIGSQYNDYENEYAYSVGRNYYADNPQDDKPKRYAEYWQDYLINGRASVHYTIERAECFDLAEDSEDFLDMMVYGPKGASILGDDSEVIVDGMCEYPDNYIGKAYLLKDFVADNINNYVYSCDWFMGGSAPFTIYDYRDNVNSPTVFENGKYDMYVIFLGNYMDYNEVGLEFALIALEKCE